MVTIYPDYGDEPRDVFLALPENLEAEFYTIETDDFVADIDFFDQLLEPEGQVLELGCGPGRIAARLAKSNRPFTGIDISLPMLQRAVQKRHIHCRYTCMNMVKLSFTTRFHNILIACNTLNLLSSPKDITACLRGCRRHLHPRGTLLAQIFIPTKKFIGDAKKTFQFQMFDRPGGGKIIKEIIKHYIPLTKSICVEERFRVRPMRPGSVNEDYRSTYTIAGFSASEWLAIFRAAGFTLTAAFGDYHGRPFDDAASSLLLASFSSSSSR